MWKADEEFAIVQHQALERLKGSVPDLDRLRHQLEDEDVSAHLGRPAQMITSRVYGLDERNVQKTIVRLHEELHVLVGFPEGYLLFMIPYSSPRQAFTEDQARKLEMQNKKLSLRAQ